MKTGRPNIEQHEQKKRNTTPFWVIKQQTKKTNFHNQTSGYSYLTYKNIVIIGELQ